MGEKSNPSFTHHVWYFYHELIYIRLLLMVQLQILSGDLQKRHLGLIWCHQQVFADKSRLKRATGMGVVSLSSPCQDASPNMQHDLLGSPCDLRVTLTWGQILTLPIKVTGYMFRPRREEHVGDRIRPLAFLVQKVFTENVFANFFWRFVIPSA